MSPRTSDDVAAHRYSTRGFGAENVTAYHDRSIGSAFAQVARTHEPSRAHSAALHRLADEAAEAITLGAVVPCVTGTPAAPSSWWTSEDRDEQKVAARACAACPVVEVCREAGRFEAGVWGGEVVAHGPARSARVAAFRAEAREAA